MYTSNPCAPYSDQFVTNDFKNICAKKWAFLNSKYIFFAINRRKSPKLVIIGNDIDPDMDELRGKNSSKNID
jgi:hypothetical protein